MYPHDRKIEELAAMIQNDIESNLRIQEKGPNKFDMGVWVNWLCESIKRWAPGTAENWENWAVDISFKNEHIILEPRNLWSAALLHGYNPMNGEHGEDDTYEYLHYELMSVTRKKSNNTYGIIPKRPLEYLKLNITLNKDGSTSIR